MGVFGLVNGQWKFFPNVAAAQAAGAVNISKQPELRHKPGGPPRDPRMYWDEMTGQWRFPQPDGSTPGKMPSIGLPGDPGSEIAPFPPSGPPKFWPPDGPPIWQPGPPDDSIGIPIDGPPQKYPDKPIYDYPPIGPEWDPVNPFQEYVMKYPDLMEAYKKHKSKGGKGDIKSWGKLHYDRHGKKEGRKLSPVGPPPSDSIGTPVHETKPTPNWDKYLSSNPDLMQAFGTDVEKAKQHWSQFGSKEKRKFTPYA